MENGLWNTGFGTHPVCGTVIKVLIYTEVSEDAPTPFNHTKVILYQIIQRQITDNLILTKHTSIIQTIKSYRNLFQTTEIMLFQTCV